MHSTKEMGKQQEKAKQPQEKDSTAKGRAMERYNSIVIGPEKRATRPMSAKTRLDISEKEDMAEKHRLQQTLKDQGPIRKKHDKVKNQTLPMCV